MEILHSRFIGSKAGWRGFLKVLVAMAIVIQVGILAITCMYSFCTADDYWHAMVAGGTQDSIGGLLRAAWSFNVDRYLNWNGMYLTMFIQILFCPLNMGFISVDTGLHIILLIDWLLFVGMTWLVTRRVVQWLGISSGWGCAGCFALYLTIWLNLYSYSEDFLWFSGATSYTMPMICAGAGLALCLPRYCGRGSRIGQRSAHGNGPIRILCSGLLFFLAAGGSLEIALAMCWLLLILVIAQVCRDRRIRMQALVPVAFAYIGTLINGIAPGNYARQATTEEGSVGLRAIYHALQTTLFETFDELSRLFNTSVLGFGIVAAVLAGIILHGYLRRERVHQALLIVIGMLPLPFVEVFPIALGYGGILGLPGRAMLLIAMTTAALCLIPALCAGWYLAEIWNNRRALLSVTTLAMLIVMMTDNVALYRTYDTDHVKQLPMSVLAMDWQKGWTRYYYEDVQAFYQRIADAAGTDLVLCDEDFPDTPNGLMDLVVHNADCVAEYYGLNSLTVE